MAKTIEEFKKEWAIVKQGLEEADDELKSANESRGMMDGTIEEGAKEIGRRVRVLRQQGWQGDEIGDYLRDPQVKQMMSSIGKSMAGIEQNLNRVKIACEGPYAKLVDRYMKLGTAVTTEIKNRKKELSTKAGLGNKSLPQMEQLLKDMNALTKTKVYIDTYVDKKLPKIATFEKSLEGWLKDELAKSEQDAFVRDRSERFDRLIVDRNLNKNFGKVRTLFNNIQEAVKAGKLAKQKNDTAGVGAAMNTIRENFQPLEQIVAEYKAAEQELGAWIRNASNYDKIQKALDGMDKMLKYGEEAIKGF